MIPEFIKSNAVLKGLLKDMQEMKQLSDGEVEEVMKQESIRNRTSHLTSMVMRKGDAFRENFFSKLAERNPKFYSPHCYDLDPVDKLIQVQSQFVESVSDAVIEGLLKDMLEMKVLSDEDVEEVRDAPQNTGLQSWLVEQINSGRYPGLSWTNEALKQFRILWKYDDRKDLTPEDTMIFKGWAVSTGRYREGIDQPDPADWRRHFQRALDKDESLVLRADHSRDPVDPHKIYWSEDILADKTTKIKLEKARCLIGLLVEKGCAASGKCLSNLAERDPSLYRTLRLHHHNWRLCRMIPEFIKSAVVLEGLLKEMQEMKLLSDGEVEEVKKQVSTQDRISHLTGMVMRKGDDISENLLSKLAERDLKFYSRYGPGLDPVDRLMQVQSQFVESVSDAVIEGLLKDMLEMKVLSDEDVEEVRDAPQNTGLQPWLVEQINSGRYPGLSWTNEALKQFRIPWKHDDQQDLTPEDTMIFKDWAVVTGRYREGIDQPDPADWRRHFQRTLDKDESLVLRADHSRDPVDPHKIYWSEDILAGWRLYRRIPEFIKSAAVLEGLLKDMQEMKQLSDGEVKEVMKQASTQDRTSHVISMVMRKGVAIRENLFSKLAERNPEFYSTHGPSLDPVVRLRRVQSQFAERVSDAVMEGLLKDMLEMKMLSDEDVEEVRDAPQNTRLQPWLVEQINSVRYPGLSWTNEALKQFRIPWKHDDQKDLTLEDTMIFKGWAAATGRYREGIDQPDPADWRRHFQRTLDKDESLVLCADHSRDPVDPHNIYQISMTAGVFQTGLEEQGQASWWRVKKASQRKVEDEQSEGRKDSQELSPEYKKEKGNCDPVSETSQDYHSMCEAADYEVITIGKKQGKGEYQCEITALIFDVASPAEVVYGTEQWEKCPLDQNSLLPASPLYDINSPSGALKHLSFPHSECSPEVQNHLMVAHYKNDNVEMIKPSEVTETHIKIKVTEMSLFGLVRRLLKYKSKAQAYDFVRDYSPNFPPTFEIFLNNDVEELTLKIFKSTKRDASVWSRRVLLDDERLKAVRTRLIEGLNASVIRDLLDDMLHMNVLNDGEVESVKEGQTCTKDKASCLIDMVRKKGASASGKLIYKLAERDPALYVTLGLHRQSVD
ncbi:UNVERIFIED_CONTAM: hypothetical protein FKN15_040614 [Acipenser sinensis]